MATMTAVIEKLHSKHTSVVYNSLVQLRTSYLKKPNGVAKFRQNGGLGQLLTIIKETKSEKILDIAFSILGNCCMEEKSRQSIHRLEAIETIVGVLKKSTVKSIQNRVCRTLGNLAQDPDCCKVIHEDEELFPVLVKAMSEDEDPNSLTTYCRTLRLLGDTQVHRRPILDAEGLRAVAKLLKFEDENVLQAALKTVAALTKEITYDHTRQLLPTDAPASLISLSSHDNANIVKSAYSLLLSWTDHEELRTGIGNGNGITYFMGLVNKDGMEENSRKKFPAVNALCLCCNESVNRVKIRESEGLQLILDLLKSKAYLIIHNRLIGALICYLYDEASLQVLLDNGLVLILLKQLVKCYRKDWVDLENLDSLSLKEEDCTELKHIGTSDVLIESLEEEEEAIKYVVISSGAQGEDITTNKGTGSETDRNILANSSDHGMLCIDTSSKDPVVKDLKDTAMVDSLSSLDQCQVKSSKTSTICYDVMEDKHEEQLHDIPGTTQNKVVLDESESHETASSQTGETLPELSEKQTTHKYSIDSPTYRAVAEWKMDENLSGPRNLEESILYYGNTSPDRRSGFSGSPRGHCYSPISSTSSYVSSHWSPESSPLRSLSPVSSISDERGFSPINWSPQHASTSDFDHQWSPVSAGSQSPEHGVHYSPWWHKKDATEDAHFSSSEEDVNDTTEVKTMGASTSVENDKKAVTSTVESHKVESCKELTTKKLPKNCPSLEVEDLGFPSMTNTSSLHGGDLENKNDKKSKKQLLVSSSKRKRSRTLSLEDKKKIQESLESQKRKAPKLDITDLIASSDKTGSSVSQQKDLMRREKPRDPKKIPEYHILVLISRLSHYEDPTHILVNRPCFYVLLDYFTKVQEPQSRCKRILYRLTHYRHCFEAVILKMIPSLIHKMLSATTRSSTTSACKVLLSTVESKGTTQMEPKTDKEESKTHNKSHLSNKDSSKTSVKDSQGETHFQESASMKNLKDQLLGNLMVTAESHYGRGVLAHILLRGSKERVIRCALMLPYVCRSRHVQRKLYLELYGLSHIIAVLQTDDSSKAPFYHQAIISIRHLAKNLNIKYDQDRKREVEVETHLLEKCPHSIDVTFLLDDGLCVNGNKEKLIAESEVFQAMLSGHFSESRKSEIQVQNASYEAFEALVTFLLKKNCDFENMTSSQEKHLQLLLEISALADRFLVPQLQDKVSDVICRQFMSSQNFQGIISHSVLHNMEFLTNQCVIYALTGEQDFADTVTCFQALMNVEFKRTDGKNALLAVLTAALEK